MDNDQQECTHCEGTGITKPKIQDLNKLEEGKGLQYQPIECEHCKGKGWIKKI